MKIYLFIFLLLLSTVSCKNSYTTSTLPSLKKLSFDSTAYMNITHGENDSVLRRKLLNIALESELNNAGPFSAEDDIASGDQFKFKMKEFKLTPLLASEYLFNKENSAEVIISHQDHLEIFFVPAGLSREKVLSQLGKNTEKKSAFYWVQSNDEYLDKNKTYYLVNATRKQMKENDIFFHKEIKNIGNDFNGRSFNFSSNQVIVLKIAAEFFEKERTFEVLKRRSYTCNSRDAGICDPCIFRVEVTTANFIKRAIGSADLANLNIIINGRSYPITELKPTSELNGIFNVTLDLKAMGITDMALLELHQNTQPQIIKNVIGLDYANSCISTSYSRNIDVTPRLKADLEINVFGRNLGLF